MVAHMNAEALRAHHRDRRGLVLVALAQRALAQGRDLRPDPDASSRCGSIATRMRSGPDGRRRAAMAAAATPAGAPASTAVEPLRTVLLGLSRCEPASSGAVLDGRCHHAFMFPSKAAIASRSRLRLLTNCATLLRNRPPAEGLLQVWIGLADEPSDCGGGGLAIERRRRPDAVRLARGRPQDRARARRRRGPRLGPYRRAPRRWTEAGYTPDVIAGTSIGAVVGGCYAAGKLDAAGGLRPLA